MRRVFIVDVGLEIFPGGLAKLLQLLALLLHLHEISLEVFQVKGVLLVELDVEVIESLNFLLQLGLYVVESPEIVIAMGLVQ